MTESFLSFVHVCVGGRVCVHMNLGILISEEGINPLELELHTSSYEPPNVGCDNQTNC